MAIFHEGSFLLRISRLISFPCYDFKLSFKQKKIC